MENSTDNTSQISSSKDSSFSKAWFLMTDVEKAQSLLNSRRLSDIEVFQKDFGSFEDPQFEITSIHFVPSTNLRHIKLVELMNRTYT